QIDLLQCVDTYGYLHVINFGGCIYTLQITFEFPCIAWRPLHSIAQIITDNARVFIARIGLVFLTELLLSSHVAFRRSITQSPCRIPSKWNATFATTPTTTISDITRFKNTVDAESKFGTGIGTRATVLAD